MRGENCEIKRRDHKHENKRETAEGDTTAHERITHERTGHAMHDPRCETCLKVRGVTTHPHRAFAEAADFDKTVVKNSQQGAEVKILGAGPRGEPFARAVHRKDATFEVLEQFM